MKCPLCDDERPDKHGKTSKGALSVTSAQNVAKLLLKVSLCSTNERQVSAEQVRIVLQSHAEGGAKLPRAESD